MTDQIHPTPPAEPDLTADLTAISHWADPVTVPDTRDLDARAIRYEEHTPSGPAWQRMVLAAAAVVLVVAGVWAFTRSDRQSPAQPTPTVTDSTVPRVTGDSEWIETSAAPLQPRNLAQAVWNGSEVIVFGGTDQPQCAVCDYFAYGATLHDSAAYDPATDTWRTIAPLPDDASYVGASARVGNDVYWMSVTNPSTTANGWTGTLYRYVSASDTWEQVQVLDEVPQPPALTAWGSRLVLYPAADYAGNYPVEVLDPATSTWQSLTGLPFAPADQRSVLDLDGTLTLFSARGADGLTNVATFDPSTSSWTEAVAGTVDGVPYAVVDGRAVGGEHPSQLGVRVAVEYRNGQWNELGPLEGEGPVAGYVGARGAWFGLVQGLVVEVDTGLTRMLPPLQADIADVQGAAVTAAGDDLFVFGGNLTGVVPGELTSRAFVWRSGPVATPSQPGTTEPTTASTTAPEALPNLQPSGACGAVAFYAIDTAATASVEVYLDLGGTLTDRRFGTTAEVGSSGVVITLRRGANLGEAICNDVISTLRVDSEAHAVGGSVVIDIGPKAGTEADAESTCGNTTGTAEVTNLVFDDGTVIDRLSLGGVGVNCFAG